MSDDPKHEPDPASGRPEGSKLRTTTPPLGSAAEVQLSETRSDSPGSAATDPSDPERDEPTHSGAPRATEGLPDELGLGEKKRLILDEQEDEDYLPPRAALRRQSPKAAPAAPESPKTAPAAPESPKAAPAAPESPKAAPGPSTRTLESEMRSSHPEARSDARNQTPVWKKIALIGAIVVLLGAVGSVLTVVLGIQHFSRDLPDVRQLQQGYAPPQVTRVLARDDTLLANVFVERRTVVPFEKVPDHVKSAFLAAEDAGFFEHEGLDYFGLVRAMIANLRAGRVKQGGSTITQQVVKNVLLDHERSYRRKIRETILAYRLEQTLTKQQILGMYMNHIYLGHGRYGVEEAGRFYFGKHVDELNIAEAALLAGIVAAPERYSPRKSEDKALARRAYVLGQMLDKGFMTRRVYQASLDAPLRLSPEAESESDIAPEMVAHAQRTLRELVGDQARRGGFTIQTTIDPALQVAARKALRAGLDDYMTRQKLAPPFTLEDRRLWGKVFEGTPRRHRIYVGKVAERNDDTREIRVAVGDTIGIVSLDEEERFNPKHLSPTAFVGEGAALRVRVLDEPADATDEQPVRLRLELGPQAALVALDPNTREVLAAVGNYEAVAGGLDRTFQTKRQPGSTFKPIVYSYALNTHQITAATQFEVTLTKEERARLEKERAASPEGEEGSTTEEVPQTTTMSLREGIARSDNRVARQVFRQVGGQQAVQWAQAMGIVSHLGADESLMLGSYEVTVTEMASAFSVFASGGTARDPLFIRKIDSGSGPVQIAPRAPERRVMDPAVAYLMTNLLESVVKEGTAKRASSMERPLAGKTGTTNDAKDAWFVGYSTDLVVAVWVGYDDALPLGWGESGARSALPIWMDFMEAAHEAKPATQFPRPGAIQEALIDPESGLLARFGQESAVTEIFLPGTLPEDTAPDSDETPSGDLDGDPAIDPGDTAPQDDDVRGPDAGMEPQNERGGDTPPPPPPVEDEPPPF